MADVQFFVTCLIDSFYPSTGHAVVNILRRLGRSVEFQHEQTCCAQPLFNAGLRAQARPVAEHNLRILEQAEGDIVLASGSCAHMLKHNFSELFADDPICLSRARALSGRIFEFTAYLVDRLGVTDVGARWDGILTYHPSCHTLRGMNIDRQPRLLLSHVRGAQVVELPEAEDCCGFGGVFSVEHPELSGELLKRKIGNLETTLAPTLVVAEAGCMLHLAGGLHRQKKPQRVLHIAQVLDHQ